MKHNCKYHLPNFTMSFMKEEIRMERIKYHGVAIGGKIYSLRMAKRMSQEQLAAVSKWERNLSNPSIEMLWVLADFLSAALTSW